MKVNVEGIKVKGKKFCNFERSFFIIEDEQDEQEAKSRGFDIYSLELLPCAFANNLYRNKTVNNWKLTKQYIQGGVK